MQREYVFVTTMTSSGKSTIANQTQTERKTFSNQDPYFSGIGYFKSTPIIELDSFYRQFLFEDIKDASLICNLFNSFLDGEHFSKQTDDFQKLRNEKRLLMLHTKYYVPGTIFVLPKDVQLWYEKHKLLADNDHFIVKYDFEDFVKWYDLLLDQYHSNKKNKIILLEEEEFLADVWSKIKKEAKC